MTIQEKISSQKSLQTKNYYNKLTRTNAAERERTAFWSSYKMPTFQPKFWDLQRKKYSPPTEEKAINRNGPRARSDDRLTKQDFKLAIINMFKKQREAKIKELKQSIRTISINRKIIYIQEVANRKYNNLLKKILKFSLENSLEKLNSIIWAGRNNQWTYG